MRRVLEGGVGCCSGGMLDRSRLRDFLEDLLEDRVESWGLDSGEIDAIVKCVLGMWISVCTCVRGREREIIWVVKW